MSPVDRLVDTLRSDGLPTARRTVSSLSRATQTSHDEIDRESGFGCLRKRVATSTNRGAAMTESASTDVQLDRAHLEGRVIASNLEHLEMTMGEQDPGLREELGMLARTFGEYVSKLRDASGVASQRERSREAPATLDEGTDTVVA
jgi:hypothetical protein